MNTHLIKDKKVSFIHRLKSMFSWMGSKSTNEELAREEYHLTPQGGDLKSKTMLLNGVPLEVTKNGDIPYLKPSVEDVNSPLTIAPLTIKFIQFPNFDASSCK
nr:heparanase-like protein 2 [Tanacetum cinerariifolium]